MSKLNGEYMISGLIRINIDPAERIAELYNISLKTANTIVSDREQQGFYTNPEELSRIEGISFELAKTLSPHIDWRFPPEQEPEKAKQWYLFVFLLISIIGIVLIGIDAIPDFLNLFSKNVTPTWLNLINRVSCFSGLLSMCVVFVLMLISTITRSWSLIRRYFRYQTFFMIICIFCLFIIYPSLFYLIEFDNHGRFSRFIISLDFLIISIVGIIMLILLLSHLVAALCSRYVVSNLRQIINTVFYIMLSPASVAYVVVRYDELSFFELLLAGFGGIAFFVLGIQAIQTGETLFHSSIYIRPEAAQMIIGGDYWLEWLNNFLDDTTSQKELKNALLEAYPPSKARTFAGMIVLNAGGWLLIVVFSAIIEWVVQGGLDRVFPWFK